MDIQIGKRFYIFFKAKNDEGKFSYIKNNGDNRHAPHYR